MATSGPSQLFVQLSSSEEGNWLSLGRALTSVLCRGLRPYIRREMDLFYSNVTAAVTALGGGPCTCVNDPGRKKNQYHDMSTCAWAQILEGVHIGNKPNWKQSDSTKWMDPENGQWEIAKLFRPDAGGHTVIESAEDLDITGILNIMYWCNHFTVQRPLIESVRQIRNTKWGHIPKSELSEAEKCAAFETIEGLLQDPVFVGDPHAQDALRDILALKCTSDVHIFKVKDLSHFEDAMRKDISDVKRKLKSLPGKKSKKNEKQKARLEIQVRNFKQALRKLEKKSAASARKKSEKKSATSLSSLFQILVLPIAFVGISIMNVGKMQRKSFISWIKLLLLCCCIVVLDHRSFKDGCPTEDIGVPFDTKEFNLTDYLTIARENFIGRRWLYQEIENVFHPSRQGVSGVLIIGDPGAGKSALTAQLVCSRTSSRTIHDHVLGYHLCKHSDRNTQNGGKFVRNLADMIARRLPEYGYIVTNNSYIQRSLESDCVTLQDPVGCFEQAILSPLRLLKNKPKENWYIVIDALDECLTQSETGHSIVYLLNNKLPRFPSWMKLVMTSRNESSVSINSNSVMKLIIDPDDIRNIEDIELFLSSRLLQDGPLINQIKFWFGDDSIKNTARLISALLSKSQGNFLFVKEMLHHWETSRAEKRDPYALPETLGDLYQSFFERLYSRKEQFQPIRRVLELLVATFQPLSLKGIYEVLKTKEENLEEEYEFKDRINGLGHFLRYGENDTVTLYHLSLTEWLISENNKNSPFYVSKKKGHEMFCDFYLILIADGDKSSLLKYILILAQHITYGGWKESYVKQFLKFPSQVVNSSDPTSNKTLLHLAATINSTDVLELLLQHFSCIDCIDNRGITPAFLAAEHGLVNNLALMVRKGAKVNRKTKSLLSIFESKGSKYDAFDIKDYLWTPVLQSKSKYWGSTMLHAAAHRGHADVVTFLLDNGAFISTVDGVNLTALQIAAENGHLEVVKALYNAGAAADQTSLHHAAANGRLEVVKYLMKIGVRDRCIRCDGTFYWLKARKHRLQSNVKTTESVISFHINKQCFENTMQIQKKHCVKNKTEIATSFGELYDDKHLIFCETALHSAVSAGHVEVVRELISSPPTALTCRDYTGRTALHEAVRRNNSEIVKIILKEDPALIHETCNHWQSVEQQNETHTSLMLSSEESLEYHGDVCPCGYTPLHMAARYGHWEIGILLNIIGGARVDAPDCFGATPLHVAACHNHNLFVHTLMSSERGVNINSRSSNGSTPLHSAAACGAVEIINVLKYYGADPSVVDTDGLSALHYTILHIHPSHLNRKILLNRTYCCGTLHLLTIDRRGHLARFYHDNNIIRNTDHYRWLDTLINLILLGCDIDAVDINGRTSLHIAAANGLADAVNVLLQKKSNPEIRDRFGKIPLEVAVENCPAGSITLPFNRKEERFDELRHHLRDHEMVVYLLLSSGASLRKCSLINGTSLLHLAVAKSQPYIAQLLFMKGASLNCKDCLGRTPLEAFIQNGGDWADYPFNTSFKIKCGKPLHLSNIHLSCYVPPKLEENNFFQLITCDDRKCSSTKSPFQRAIERHRLKQRVVDNCLDDEGFTLLHRAAQGANLVAVRSLIKIGANLTLLSPQGQDAITLSILHSGGNVWSHLRGNDDELLAKKDNASVVALELLHHMMKTRGFRIVCDSNKSELTLYHLAASRGLVKFIQEIFKEKEQHQLDVNCPNKDGITPLYLAKVFSFQRKGARLNPWKETSRIIEDHGGKMMFPTRHVERNLFYKRMYGWIPDDLELNLRPDVRGFVFGIMSTFQNRQSTPVKCNSTSFYDRKGIQIGFPLSLHPINEELSRQLQLLSERDRVSCCVWFSLEHDLRKCLLQRKRSDTHLQKINLLKTTRFINAKPVYRWAKAMYSSYLRSTPLVLFQLMRMWHQTVFQSFACLKIVSYKYHPVFLDENILKQRIAEYERSMPTWLLGEICLEFMLTFRTYVLSYLSNSNYSDFDELYHEYPDFIKKRMMWTDDGKHDSWPFDFLVKFSLGLYHQYEYLKILNVGLEPGTHVVLPSEERKKATKMSTGKAQNT